MEAKKNKKVWPKTNAWGCYAADDGQYQQFADGDMLVGMIRCTYVELFDADDNKVCSLNVENTAGVNTQQKFGTEYDDLLLFYTEKSPCKSKEKIAVKLNITPYKYGRIDDEAGTAYLSNDNLLKQQGVKVELQRWNEWLNMLNGKAFAYVRPNAVRWFKLQQNNHGGISENLIQKPQQSLLAKLLVLGLTAYGTIN